jgi:hypothetical protein
MTSLVAERGRRGGCPGRGASRRPWSALIAPVILGTLMVLAGTAPSPVGAQSTVGAMAEECHGGSPLAPVVACEDAALILQATQWATGLLTTAGGALPASPSTSGMRLMGSPRVIVDGGLALVNVRFPEPGRDLAGFRDDRMTLVGARMVTTVGIFDGFSPVPTVGGVLGVDGVASLRYHRLPGDVGFDGNVWAWGGGVRVGLLRESFSLPGVTITTLHHRVGQVGFDRVVERGTETETIEVRLRQNVTLVRAEVGKDLLALGITVGGGWDRYSGSGRMAVERTTGPFFDGSAGPERITSDRTYLFAGVNFTWVVVQATGEVGWAGAPSRRVELDGSGPSRPDAGSLQAAFTFRITY